MIFVFPFWLRSFLYPLFSLATAAHMPVTNSGRAQLLEGTKRTPGRHWSPVVWAHGLPGNNTTGEGREGSQRGWVPTCGGMEGSDRILPGETLGKGEVVVGCPVYSRVNGLCRNHHTCGSWPVVFRGPWHRLQKQKLSYVNFYLIPSFLSSFLHFLLPTVLYFLSSSFSSSLPSSFNSTPSLLPPSAYEFFS